MVNLVKIQDDNYVKFDNNIIDFLTPKQIFIPFSTDSLKKGDYVYKNESFNDYISSISGHVNSTKNVIFNNKNVCAWVIDNDYKENITNKLRKKNITTIEELFSVLEIFKLKRIKEKIKKIDFIENLVVSSIDEESSSAKEFFYLSNYYREILYTINELLKIFNLKESTLTTKNTSYKSILNVKSISGTYPNIKFNLVPDKYLISNPVFLSEYLNLNINNTLILTTSEIYYIYNALNIKSVFETIITISGDCISKPLVLRVKLYTSLLDILNEFFEIDNEEFDIYVNGYLGGSKINSIDDIIITMDTKSFVINKKIQEVETECINCGACERICPMKINVKRCYFGSKQDKKCLNCGLCNYICPAKLNLKSIVGGNNEEI